MKCWDTSALLPLFITEPMSDAVRALLSDDPGILVWGLTPVELISAVWRRPDQRAEATRRAIAETIIETQSKWSKIVTYGTTGRLAFSV